MSKKLYLISYDISCDKRARRALNVLKDYSLSCQKSVFECWLNRKDYLLLQTLLAKVLDPTQDSLLSTELNTAYDFYILGTAPNNFERIIYFG